MTRVKTGVVTRRKHNKILDLAKGYRMSRRRLIKTASEAVLHAGEYAFMGRKLRKRDFRALWIIRMNALLREIGTKYSIFIHNLKKNNVELDRKVLAMFAVEKPEIFKKIVSEVSKKN
ncbi:50S ribosomal protein L20 [Candidatus Roizmanbacteria bacterium RIFCSPLOWO2_01_FULL_38_11]|uniref:Large ribosomal subunit protein bL20 n=1 Tax=Candidatus Roizmanbacteria bacterium RIFCSPLOWO2_01_FULL_38_11 TaxID=1802060 RepID=A0A1F7IP01_9BACT|nr:MAG: 50S ribosomal protein L20 [Candidatus Roizmanbacteria bacterium RIFCSPLOWO2_01_FULL_38_11]